MGGLQRKSDFADKKSRVAPFVFEKSCLFTTGVQLIQLPCQFCKAFSLAVVIGQTLPGHLPPYSTIKISQTNRCSKQPMLIYIFCRHSAKKKSIIWAFSNRFFFTWAHSDFSRQKWRKAASFDAKTFLFIPAVSIGHQDLSPNNVKKIKKGGGGSRSVSAVDSMSRLTMSLRIFFFSEPAVKNAFVALVRLRELVSSNLPSSAKNSCIPFQLVVRLF